MNDRVPAPLARASDKARTPLVFLHIPKTAGTTLWLILRRQYSPEGVLRVENASEIRALPQERLAPVKVLLGHFEYGVGEAFPQAPDYITIMRDPVERILSSYGHFLRAVQAQAAQTPFERRARIQTLDEYVASGFGEIDNRATRSLAGPEAAAAPHGACTEEMFEAAKKNLADGVAVVGLTERFDEMLVILQRRYGWNMPLYVRENVGTNRIQSKDVPDDVLEKIWQASYWDRQLYAFAAARFDAQVAAEGPDFIHAVRRFQWANRCYGRMKALFGSGPLHLLKSLLPMRHQMGLETAVRSTMRRLSRGVSRGTTDHNTLSDPARESGVGSGEMPRTI